MTVRVLMIVPLHWRSWFTLRTLSEVGADDGPGMDDYHTASAVSHFELWDRGE